MVTTAFDKKLSTDVMVISHAKKTVRRCHALYNEAYFLCACIFFWNTE